MEYETDKIEDRIKENAALFKDIIKTTLVDYYNQHKKPGIVVSPFNAEFFGHYWFEGPKWLYYTLKEINADHELKPITCSQYLQYTPPSIKVGIREGSWGEGDSYWLWLNESTEWTWKYIYESEKIMQELATKFADTQDGIIQTILKQLGRQLFLLQSSDWQFLITTWLRKDYAEHRVIRHYEAFKELTKILMKYSQKEHIELGELNFFDFIKKGDGLFPDISPDWWVKD